MRQFQTSVLELRESIADGFATQPFECAWAGEAIFFIHVDEGDGTHLAAYVQISPDGIRWLDEGTVLPAVAGQDAFFLRVLHFGGWLRLRFSGEDAMRATIRLVLKE